MGKIRRSTITQSRPALRDLGRTIFTKRTASLATIPLIMILAFFVATTFEQQSGITNPLGNYAKAGWKLFDWNSDNAGLRWVKTDDPRSRKADRLPVHGGGN